MGSTAEWGERGGYDGEGVEWERVGGGEWCSLSYLWLDGRRGGGAWLMSGDI